MRAWQCSQPRNRLSATNHRHNGARGSSEAQGTPIGVLDTLIAAQAISERLILVTNNVRGFSRVPGLLVEDWTQ
ncbi:hypothetical protein [Chloroflexus sp.]|uniref:hypothetical protein n=1 Tax=Chloroflexus sp. TaxID=1904827 RepID=UPI002ACD3A30|nr:hypothetical protein [Chloroflexus sp.]